eukprot:CAMPEP_0184685728 /NCGR_PEP_ID=MMETSP0312-20130426/19950_1 /TAXON_ID=31354 /ORGANISM="Compsopogon coeruleus, Strain SAG 36.94" /LENGTH=43 /DNA_ID= /DNA_START= /DNA_END= /DNA_ORIENTATION=
MWEGDHSRKSSTSSDEMFLVVFPERWTICLPRGRFAAVEENQE